MCFTNAVSKPDRSVMLRVALLSLAGCLAALPCTAQSQTAPAGASSYASATEAPAAAWEARLGGAFADLGGRENGLFNLSGEVLSPRLFQLQDRIASAFIPRFNLGSSINLNGTRYAYAGATWTFDIGRDVFVEASLAAALNDGKTGGVVPENRLSVGCNAGTREAAALGFRLSRSWSLVTTLEHFSTAGCSGQPGTASPRGPANIGARIGYTF